jgi:structural maintenance of chromosome 1
VNSQAILVDTDKTAHDGIKYLKEQRVGVATFIPCDSVRVDPIRESFREFGGSVKLLIDVIEDGGDPAYASGWSGYVVTHVRSAVITFVYSSSMLDCECCGSVQKALLYAVSNTLVCDSLDEARRLAYADPSKRYKVRASFRTYTDEGTLIAESYVCLHVCMCVCARLNL